MLSRTAENLYWLARYMERAETMARLLEVGYRMALMPSAGEGYRNEWASLVAAAGVVERLRGEVRRGLPRSATSRPGCSSTARTRRRVDLLHRDRRAQNGAGGAHRADHRDVGRAERRLSRAARARAAAAVRARCCRSSATGPSGRAALLRGATEGTHLQNDGYDFLNIGYYLERGDNTARLLDVKYYVLLPTTDMVGGVDRHLPVDDAAARAVGATGPSTGPTAASTRPRKIAHFLILNRACPRSLLHCQDKVGDHLGRLAQAYGQRTARARRGCTRCWASSPRREVEDIIEEGLHEFLTRFIHQNARARRRTWPTAISSGSS